MVVTAFSTAFTGCSDEEKEEKKSASDSSTEESYESEDDSSSDNDSSGSIFNNSSNESEDTLAEQLLNSESAYVGVWYGKFFLGTSYYPNGNAYESWQDEDEYWTDDVDLEFFNEISLLYFNNGEFEQYLYPPLNGNVLYNYKGSYDIGDNDQLILEYQQKESTSPSSGETTCYDLNDITYEYDKSTDTYTFDDSSLNRPTRVAYECMFRANANQYLLGDYQRLYKDDSTAYFGACCYKDASSGKYFPHMGSTAMTTNCLYYFKNNYIVTEQYGYSFKSYVSRSEFTLECDMEEYPHYDASSTIGIDHLTIRFYDDNTCISTDANTGEEIYYSTWELYDDNLLVITPDDMDEVYLLYLDFENEEIYVPVFCRCDEFIEVKEKFESYYEDEY